MKKQKRIRRPSYEYCVRITNPGNRTGLNYALTIPRVVVKKYNLYKKKFKLEVSLKGKLILYVRMDK